MLLWSDRVSVKIASPSLSFRQPDDDRPRKRHVWGDEGKAVGCVPPTALLFVALGQRSRGVYCRFVFDEMDRASSRFPDLEARGDPLVSLLSLRDLQAAKRLMINRHGDVLGQIRLQRVNSSRAPDDDPTLTERIN